MSDATQPRTRVRISHSKTIKGGWGFESTVEADWGDGVPDPDALARIEQLLKDVDMIGRTESQRRNLEEGPFHD